MMKSIGEIKDNESEKEREYNEGCSSECEISSAKLIHHSPSKKSGNNLEKP